MFKWGNCILDLNMLEHSATKQTIRNRNIITFSIGFLSGSWLVTISAFFGLYSEFQFLLALIILSASGIAIGGAYYSNLWGSSIGKGLLASGIIFLVSAIIPPQYNMVFIGPMFTVSLVVLVPIYIISCRFFEDEQSEPHEE